MKRPEKTFEQLEPTAQYIAGWADEVQGMTREEQFRGLGAVSCTAAKNLFPHTFDNDADMRHFTEGFVKLAKFSRPAELLAVKSILETLARICGHLEQSGQLHSSDEWEKFEEQFPEIARVVMSL